MALTIRQAKRSATKLRLFLTGPSGSGKTYGALLVAKGLGARSIIVIDTEQGSSDLYDTIADFGVIDLAPPFTPERYIEAISAAEQAGADCIIVDSISHEWNGKGGCLELVDDIARAKFRGNTWSAYSEVTPRHRAFIDAMLRSSAHVIATGRSKTETAQVEEGGRKKVVKLGMKAETREGVEYEFTVCLDLIHDGHYATASKDRTGLFNGDPKPIGMETGKRLADWLAGAAPLTNSVKAPPAKSHDAGDGITVHHVETFTPPASQLFDDIAHHISVALNVRTLGRMGDRIDTLTSEGQLTSEQAEQLHDRIDLRHDEISEKVDGVA